MALLVDREPFLVVFLSCVSRRSRLLGRSTIRSPSMFLGSLQHGHQGLPGIAGEGKHASRQDALEEP